MARGWVRKLGVLDIETDFKLSHAAMRLFLGPGLVGGVKPRNPLKTALRDLRVSM